MADKSNMEYWAVRDENFADTIMDKFHNYQLWGRNSGYFERISRCYNMFYGTSQKGTLHLEKESEKTFINLNNYKSLLQRLHILITQNKLDIDILSRNSDVESQIDTDVGRGIVEYYIDSKGLGAKLSEAALTSLVCLESWVYAPWEYGLGTDQIVEEDGKTRKDGDQAYYVHTAMDVAKNTAICDSPWYIVRQRVNKWDLAANYPEYREEIVNSSMGSEIDHEYWLDPSYHHMTETLADEDATFQYIFLHKATPAVPKGRQCLVVADKLLEDDDLIYDTIPMFNLKAGSILQTAMGDSPAISLLAIQEAIDKVGSALTTNALNTAIQAFWTADPNTRVMDSGGQLKKIVSSQKPEILDFSSPNEGNYRILDLLIGQQQLLSGVNDAARGDAGKSQSGTSLSLLLAVAIQYVQDLQKGYEQLASDIGTQTIENTKNFLQMEKIAYISGKSRESYVQTYTAETLDGISRVKATLGNPVLGSFAGRWELLSTMIQHGAISDPKSILNFVRTGDLTGETEDGFNDAITIRSENELLRKGIQTPVMITDLHPEHFQKHRAVLNDPQTRRNPAVIAAVTAHMQEHIEQIKNMDPDMAAMLGISPLPSQQAPAPQVGGAPDNLAPPPPAGQVVGDQAQEALEGAQAIAENSGQPPVG